jgi:hypothetical protein
MVHSRGFSPEFPNYHLLAWGFCPLSLGFCLFCGMVASRPEKSPTLVLSISILNFYRGKKKPNTWAISVIFKKVPKVNNHPIGKNSPNLVTLEKAAVSASFIYMKHAATYVCTTTS